MGVLITTKKPLFKQKNKIHTEPIYPMHLNELTTIPVTQLTYLTKKDIEREKITHPIPQ